jgi:hypothetical protein
VKILTPPRISLRVSRAFDKIFILDYEPVFNYFGIGKEIGQQRGKALYVTLWGTRYWLP